MAINRNKVTHFNTPLYQLAIGGCDWKRSGSDVLSKYRNTYIVCPFVFWSNIKRVVVLCVSPTHQIAESKSALGSNRNICRPYLCDHVTGCPSRNLTTSAESSPRSTSHTELRQTAVLRGLKVSWMYQDQIAVPASSGTRREDMI